MKCEFSKSGLPVLWESGGGMTNTGRAQIICGPDGAAKKPIHIPRGHSCGLHALFPVAPGDLAINAWRHGGEYGISIYRIDAVDAEGNLSLTKINSYDRSEWDSPLTEALSAAVEAAKRKSRCYHCRCVHYTA